MEIAGGAMLGYCATGRVTTASPPASMITIAITHAKIGRSMKKLATAPFLRARGGRGRRSGCRCGGLHFLWFYRGAGFCELHAFNNHTVASLHAVGHEPLVADGALRYQRAQLPLVIGADHEGRGFAFLIVGDRHLRHEYRIRPGALLD